MEQQIAQTLWLPPGMCVLNPMPAMQLHPTSGLAPHQMTSQLLKHPWLTVPTTNLTTNLLHNPHLLQQPHILPPTQNIIHIPIDNLLLPPSGKHPYEVAPPMVELPCQPLNLQAENQVALPPNSTLHPTDPAFQRHHLAVSKVMKKKRISPSAKRRSRLRLIAFLEQKRKQQGEINPDENPILQSTTGAMPPYPNDATSPSSSDDAALSPQSA